MRKHSSRLKRSVRSEDRNAQALIFMLKYIALNGPLPLYKAIKAASEELKLNFEAFRAYVQRRFERLVERKIIDVLETPKEGGRKYIVDIGPNGLGLLDAYFPLKYIVLARKGYFPKDFADFIMENLREDHRALLNGIPLSLPLKYFYNKVFYRTFDEYYKNHFEDPLTRERHELLHMLDFSNKEKLKKSLAKLQPQTRKYFLPKFFEEIIEDLENAIKFFEAQKKKAQEFLKILQEVEKKK